VLSVIQEKLNNPIPEDPFEPDIAAVDFLSLIQQRFPLTEYPIAAT
jgi:hypothetical protein